MSDAAIDRIPRDGFALAARASGRGADAPALLLSNSLGATQAMWATQRPWLEARFRVISYDTRGHGASDTPPAPYSFADLEADALAVLDFYGVRRAAVMGLSLGGMTGMGLAIRHPERVSRLVVCDARADAPPAFVASWDERVARIRADGLAAIWTSTAERWFVPATRGKAPELMETMRAMFLETTVEGYAGCAAALKTLDCLRHLPRVAAPTLYVVGAEDTGSPPDVMHAMAQATPGAGFAEIPGAAHIANIDAPDAFEAAVRPFLEEEAA